MTEIVIRFRDESTKKFDSNYRYEWLDGGAVLRVSQTRFSWHVDYPADLIAYVEYTGAPRI